MHLNRNAPGPLTSTPPSQEIGHQEHHQSAVENRIPNHRGTIRCQRGRMKGTANSVAKIFVKSRGPPRTIPTLAPPDKMIPTVDNICRITTREIRPHCRFRQVPTVTTPSVVKIQRKLLWIKRGSREGAELTYQKITKRNVMRFFNNIATFYTQRETRAPFPDGTRTLGLTTNE